jgi:RNA polymerase sigma factor (sigma-70 family)
MPRDESSVFAEARKQHAGSGGVSPGTFCRSAGNILTGRAHGRADLGMNGTGVNDALLLAALAGGDAGAARELYGRHCRAILRFALALTDDPATAEDIVHDTFIELLHRPGNYDIARGSVRGYLYGIARHQVSRRLRSARPVPVEADVIDSEAQGDAGEETERAEDIDRIRAALRTLPLPFREVIVWCELEELPYVTVAGILRCPIGTVRSRLHRARALLAETLQSLRPATGNARPVSPGSGDRVDHMTSVDGPLIPAVRRGPS